VLGALASGLLLYGMSLLYGLSGSLSLMQITETLQGTTANSMQLAFALVFIVAGLGFKLGVAPFHMWVPDIYQGAPTAVTLFIASAPKIAAFAFVMRLLIDGLSFAVADWQPMLALMAVASLAVGNLAAIMQTNLKRMLAYSTIAHMGFLLLGMMAASPAGLAAGMYYAVAYAVMSLGAFGLILHMSHQGFEAENLDDWRGLNRTHPWMAALMAMLLLSMAGLPPFLGFYAKLFVLQALVGAGFITVAVVAVLLSLIGAYYYLRVVKIMYFDAPAAEPMAPSGDAAVLLSINGMAVLLLGLLPQPLLALCVQAIQVSI
jgi:NADH-quinone oxidoreductase subunit N